MSRQRSSGQKPASPWTGSSTAFCSEAGGTENPFRASINSCLVQLQEATSSPAHESYWATSVARPCHTRVVEVVDRPRHCSGGRRDCVFVVRPSEESKSEGSRERPRRRYGPGVGTQCRKGAAGLSAVYHLLVAAKARLLIDGSCGTSPASLGKLCGPRGWQASWCGLQSVGMCQSNMAKPGWWAIAGD